MAADTGPSLRTSVHPERRAATLPIALLGIGLTVFLAFYSLAQGFGLYEDDYFLVAPYLSKRPADLWPLLVDCFTTWPQGRPLNHYLPPLLTVLGARVAGLQGAYALAALWLVFNAALVFVVVRRLLSPVAALVSAVAYVLFPADSTKIFLVHASEVQGGMSFLLLGTWLWLRGGAGRAGSYPVAGLALLAYESTFLPFLAVPLLAPADRSRSVATWIRHVLCCAILIGFVVAVRVALGEGRVAEAAGRAGESLWRAVTSLGIGPWTSGRMLLRSIPAAWRHADSHGVLSAAFFAAALLLALAALARATPEPSPPVAAEPRGPARADGSLSWRRALAVGLVLWSGSYALTLVNYPPTQTIGRLTSTHVAAGWGVALALGGLAEGIRLRLAAPRLAAAPFVAVLASWLLYQHGIQRQFVEAWSLQRRYWRQVLSLAPEVRSGWTVIVEGKPAAGPRAILVNSWADILAYRAVLPAPDGPPVAYAHLGLPGCDVPFRRQGGQVEWRPEFWGGPFVPIDPSRLVLLHHDGQALTRVEAIQTPLGVLRTTAPIPPLRPAMPGPGPVAQLMFGP